MRTTDVIALARKHVGNGAAMDSSARLCLSDAIANLEEGNYSGAQRRALDSLRYSVGIFHADYKRADEGTRTRSTVVSS